MQLHSSRIAPSVRAYLGRQNGFTLVELLVVIGIIALLISILLPAMNKARQASQTTACISHLHQLGLGMAMYVNEYRGFPAVPNYYPPGYPYGYGWQDLIAAYSKTLGWKPGFVYEGGASPMYQCGFSAIKSTIFGCPMDDNPNGLSAWTSYSYNKNLVYIMGSPSWAVGNVWRPASRYRDTATLALLVCGGGTGYVCERVIWYQGTLSGTRQDCAAAYHNRQTTMLFCDGHVAQIPVDLKDPEYYPQPPYLSGYMFDPTVRVWPDYNPAMPMPRPKYVPASSSPLPLPPLPLPPLP